MRTTDSTAPPLLHTRPSLRDLGLWFVLISLAVTTLLHYLTDVHFIPYHSIYRSLYYVPIAVAAVRYGRRGGALTALTTSVLYLPHVLISWGTMPSDGFNDLLENGVFLFVGIFAGSLADRERWQRQRAQEAAIQLASANEQLRTQAALAERMRASVDTILESVDSGILTIDSTGRVTRANRAAQALLDRPIEAGDLLPPPAREYLSSGARGYQQIQVVDRTLGLHAAPLVGPRGETLGSVLVLDDLTELRALEGQIQRSQRLAALGRLAGGLAHEIRNPLGIIRAAAQMLQQFLGDNAALGEYTQVMQTEIDRVDRLIEQLLAYASPRMLQRGPLDIAQLITHALVLTRAYATQHDVDLIVEIDTELPLVEGDADLLHQVLVNLLLNGIQATPSGGTVRVSARVATDECHAKPTLALSISDTGHGILAGDLPHIFDPFFTTRADGTGLGLSIVQQIVQEHGGAIDVQSDPGAGATFVLRLPALSQQRDDQLATTGLHASTGI